MECTRSQREREREREREWEREGSRKVAEVLASLLLLLLLLSSPPGEACRSLGHIFDGILGIKSHIKVMPTLKFVVPEPWHG